MDINDKNSGSADGCLRRVSNAIVTSLGTAFYWHGRYVAKRPYFYIVVSLAVTAICGLGFLNFYYETTPERLWIPQDSDYVKTLEWQQENFPNGLRIEMALYEAENVLTPVVIQEMYRIFTEVSEIIITDEDGRNYNQSDLCYKVPVLNPSAIMSAVPDGSESTNVRRGGKGSQSSAINLLENEWSIVLQDTSLFCQIRSIIPQACLQLSILDIWGNDSARIYSLSQQDIINDVNTATLSATYMYPMNFTEMLGEVSRNSSGHIIGAKAALHQWYMEVNMSAIDQQGNAAGLDGMVDPELYEWEGEFIATLRNTSQRPQGVNVYLSTERSFGEISGETIVGDVAYLVLGLILLGVFVSVVLGEFDMVRQRPILATLGVLSAFLAVIISYGLCSAFGLMYTPVHSVLPLLLLGLGVDDMFVIVQCYKNLPPEDRVKFVLKEQMGRTLMHGGVAITVTSLTDMLAFAIGSSTVLPALQSFCVYSVVGIAALYFLQATYFVAWFTIDQRRVLDNRNGMFWCYKHKNYEPNKCSQIDLSQKFFGEFYSKYLLTTIGKVSVMVVTAIYLGASIWGVTTLRQEFNPIWFLPQSSYLYQFLTQAQYYFPDAGTRGVVYLGNLDYPAELPKINDVTLAMIDDPDISSVDSWYLGLVDYTESLYGVDIQGQALNDTFFRNILGKFLFSQSGSRYQSYFNFDANITCGKPSPTILASKFDYQHGQLDTRDQQINAMDRTKAIVAQQDFSDFAAPVAMMYSSWETDKIIAVELIRNISLALVAVFIMTLLLIANIFTSIYVLLCVAMTLVEVMALMAWWDLTIDTVSCINLVLSVGLCVDYAAHIALHFMQVKGSRDERVHRTLVEMGPPVLSGAFSTFLAFFLLAFSDSHVFISFFKIFFGVFIYGVYQGMVFLPVLLSLIGPDPYDSADQSLLQTTDISSVKGDLQVEDGNKRNDGETSDEEWRAHEKVANTK